MTKKDIIEALDRLPMSTEVFLSVDEEGTSIKKIDELVPWEDDNGSIIFVFIPF